MKNLLIPILLLLLAVPAFATTITYSDKDLFLAKVETPFLFENFSQYPYQLVRNPIVITQGDYSVVLSAANSVNGLVTGRGIIDTNYAKDTLRIDFLGCLPVTAIGGNFGPANISGGNITGSAKITLSDGTVYEDTNADLTDFVGFTSSGGTAFTRLELTVKGYTRTGFPTVDNLYAGTAIPNPEPSSLWLLATGVCGIGVVIRRKRS